MTASKAIRDECRRCKGNSLPCVSKVCNLRSEIKGSSVKKIKAHCADCVERRQDIEDCDGKILNNPVCPLFPYRFGKNPDRKKRILLAEQLKDAKKRLATARKKC